jgi:long-chain acyl-CoA synthetase
LYGDNKPYNVVLIVPSFPQLKEWAAANGVAAADNAQLVKDPKVVEFMQNEVKARCADFASYEVPKKLFMVTEPFTTDNGILTPTLKVKRREIMKRWGADLNNLY